MMKKVKKKVNEKKKEYKKHNNLHPLVRSVQKHIYDASTIMYEGSECDGNGDEIIGVDVHGRCAGDSVSVDVSEL